jgi:putative SOS response-associated peptidase YedK
MCGRFDTSHLSWSDIQQQLSGFGLPLRKTNLDFTNHDDVRPTTEQLTVRIDEGELVAEKMRWGLVPFWRNGKPLKNSAKGSKDGFNLTTFNCKTENFTEADAKPSATFKGPFQRRRCIVPASGWYEWTGEPGSKVKHRFARADSSPLWFAGMWDRCVASDVGELTSFTILTGPSADWLARYHDRAPVILEPNEWQTWMDPAADATELLKNVRPERFQVSTLETVA